jgi:hypothetical protein
MLPAGQRVAEPFDQTSLNGGVVGGIRSYVLLNPDLAARLTGGVVAGKLMRGAPLPYLRVRVAIPYAVADSTRKYLDLVTVETQIYGNEYEQTRILANDVNLWLLASRNNISADGVGCTLIPTMNGWGEEIQPKKGAAGGDVWRFVKRYQTSVGQFLI